MRRSMSVFRESHLMLILWLAQTAHLPVVVWRKTELRIAGGETRFWNSNQQPQRNAQSIKTVLQSNYLVYYNHVRRSSRNNIMDRQVSDKERKASCGTKIIKNEDKFRQRRELVRSSLEQL